MPDDDGEEAVPPEGRWPQQSGHVATPKYGEPEEPDPHDLGPPIPEAPDPTETDVEIDPDTQALFWWLVLVFNAALLALSLGVMVAAFDGKWKLGGQIFAVGAVLFGYGYLRYRRFERERDGESGDDGADPDSGSAGTTNDPPGQSAAPKGDGGGEPSRGSSGGPVDDGLDDDGLDDDGLDHGGLDHGGLDDDGLDETGLEDGQNDRKH
ncbi:MAG: hypothetical protein V5A43_01685 [Haloarculaceae archaeon]